MTDRRDYTEQRTEATGEYDPRFQLRQVEGEWIAKSLVHHEGNMVAAAAALNISRAKLYRRCREMKIDVLGGPEDGKTQERQ